MIKCDICKKERDDVVYRKLSSLYICGNCLSYMGKDLNELSRGVDQ